ncbi:MAG: DUF1353 domain-containing protein [Proteobacteria bacterium]|nr:DUF1353 domain-containing protein [Pseudomonadota bacterium]
MNLRLLLALSLLLNLTGCGYFNYQTTEKGKFGGDLEVRWVKPNQFIFLPAQNNPFYFERNGKRIQPKAMYTDGGSIPQLIWNVPGYSPWGYAPAYIIHDWIFVAHHCQDPDDGEYSFNESATILSEGIKTLMENKVAPKSYFTHYTISKAVESKIAENYWDDKKYKDDGKCTVRLDKYLIEPTLITVIRGEDLN